MHISCTLENRFTKVKYYLVLILCIVYHFIYMITYEHHVFVHHTIFINFILLGWNNF